MGTIRPGSASVQPVRLAELDGSDEARAAATARQPSAEALVAQLGGLASVFEVPADDPCVRALKHDPRTAVLIALIESEFTLGEILDMCGNLWVEALDVLGDLVRGGAIRAR